MRRPWNDPPEWQREYFGRHVQLIPAEDARGYQYIPPIPQMYVPYAGQQIHRAVPAEGTVSTPTPFDKPAPQVALRMQAPKSRAQILGEKIRGIIKGRHVGKT